MAADDSTGPVKGALGKGGMMAKGPGDNPNVSAKDAYFLKAAAAGGMKEVAMGRMAEKNGQSPEVKQIGQRMVADHTRANKEITAAAHKRGIKLAAQTTPAMDQMKGSTFDRDFLHMMAEDHNATIKVFQGEAKNGEDAELKAMAQKTLPTLKEHLMMVKQAQQKVGMIDSTQSQH